MFRSLQESWKEEQMSGRIPTWVLVLRQLPGYPLENRLVSNVRGGYFRDHYSTGPERPGQWWLCRLKFPLFAILKLNILRMWMRIKDSWANPYQVVGKSRKSSLSDIGLRSKRSAWG